MDFFATTPKGLELLLVAELRSLGAVNVAEKLAGVSFSGDLTIAYRAILWSRLANRILLPLKRFNAQTPEELYAGIQNIRWDEHLNPTGTLFIQSICSQSAITHSLFAAQKIKDAIVDQFRESYGVRPSITRDHPDISIHVYLHRNEAIVSLDLSGESLHKRGYRLAAVEAPLKENLAAAILMRAGWVEIAKANGALYDPMCGSGTLLIEAALMAADIAPGSMRDYFGFLGWKQHEVNTWRELGEDARMRGEIGKNAIPPIVGYDQDKAAIKASFANIERAGLLGKIHVERCDLTQFVPKSKVGPGLVVVNPPYGERLGTHETLKPLYALLGERLKACFPGWRAAVFSGNPELGKEMGLRALRQYALFNGAIPCKLLLFEVTPAYFVDRSKAATNEWLIRSAKRAAANRDKEAVQMFANRLRKNLKHFSRQAKRQGLSSYRVYDADLPDYAFAIDITKEAVYIKEYAAPKNIDPQKVLSRRQEALAIIPEILGVPPAQVFFSIESRTPLDKRL